MRNQHTGIYVGSKVPQTLRDAISKAIENGEYLNSSDFIRDAIKEKLRKEGFVGSRDGKEEGNQGD
jgi:Arc/MetJ-type ribon-helix-helix transcriptional regulator